MIANMAQVRKVPRIWSLDMSKCSHDHRQIAPYYPGWYLIRDQLPDTFSLPMPRSDCTDYADAGAAAKHSHAEASAPKKNFCNVPCTTIDDIDDHDERGTVAVICIHPAESSRLTS